MKMRRPLVAGNWKMNGLKGSLAEFAAIVEGYDAAMAAKADLLVSPPATLLSAFAAAAGAVGVGGQDCHAKPFGAHTGDIAAEMLADAGARAVIVGHSERRQDHRESNGQVRAKAEAARRAGLVAIVCVGETREEREAGQALDVVRGQLEGSIPDGATAADLVVAYEPVWAIGTGLTPTNNDIAEMHATLRGALTARFGAEGEGFRLLYGGSVKPENAREILAVPDVDGALVGGASLKAESFLAIARAYL
ncbi:triose-phosphate isomerase [Ancylobacter polymorphus]|uniref:Triosephosphate isomerase n=1 Tax=Ancylobacter polymorphus TaxID=223390 RepID=A0A9E7A0B8_9HYPH|nr:triose-phosphate isomerase [Ancylobacter polymorphus]UOK70048.1 triose-phosphate isomerase [Ancylobacter polymorphus]